MNIIFFIPYYNNSHFIDLQIKSFRKYLVNCKWKICVVDDSKEETVNILSGMKENIYKKCLEYPDEIIYHKFDQSLHNSLHAGDKHCTILTYIMKHLSQSYVEDFDYLCLLDADMCFIEPFDVNIELDNYDIIGQKRIQWLSNIQISDSPIIEYIFVHNCFFNLKTITNLNMINLNRIPNTTCDTGSMIIEFLFNNPQYKIKYIGFSCGCEEIADFYSFEFLWNCKIIHYLSATMWRDLKREFPYRDKLDIMSQIIDRGLNNYEKEIIHNTYINLWNPFSKKYNGIPVTRNDLIRYNLNIH